MNEREVEIEERGDASAVFVAVERDVAKALFSGPAFFALARTNAVIFNASAGSDGHIFRLDECSKRTRQPNNTGDFFEEHTMQKRVWVKLEQRLNQLVTVKWPFVIKADGSLNGRKSLGVRDVSTVQPVRFEDRKSVV